MLKIKCKKNVVTKYEYAWKYIFFYLQISSLLNYNTSKYSNTTHSEVNSMSPRNGPLGPHSPLYSSSLSNSNTAAEIQKLREESNAHKARMEHWELAYLQAKSVST